MKYLILLLSTIAIQACSQTKIKENPFASELISNKSEDHIRVKGTKFFALIPEKYEYVQELGRYQISDEQFIQFQYIPNNSWAEYKRRLKKESFGNGLITYEQITFNGFDGMYIEGEDTNTNKNDIVLLFGSANFIAMIIGATSKDSPTARNEIVDILKSIYFDQNFQLDEFELANFEFDKTISEFDLAVAGNSIFMFAKNGKADAENPFANSMLFQPLPYMSKEKQTKYFTDMLDRHKSKGFKLLTQNIKEEKDEKYNFIKLETEIEYQTKNGILNQVLISNGESTLLFAGIGYEEIENLKSIFRETIKTIKLK